MRFYIIFCQFLAILLYLLTLGALSIAIIRKGLEGEICTMLTGWGTDGVLEFKI